MLSCSFLLTSFYPTRAFLISWNFGVNVSPDIRYAFPGQTVSYSVAVSLLLGPAGTVQLTANLPGFWFSPSSTGTPPFTRTLYVPAPSAPGTYSITVSGYNINVGWRSDNVQLVVLPSTTTTDWDLSNPTMTPASPKVGDSVTFSIILRAFSSSQAFPQSVRVAAALDGTLLGYGTVSYPGPLGFPMSVSVTTPWLATEGSHTVFWTADPSPYSYNDPNRYNNQASMTFSVSAAPPPFDFSVSISPPTQRVTAGESTSFVVVASLVSGTGQLVSLSLAGLPSGVTYFFNPVSSNPTFQSTLSVTAAKTVPAGTYTFTLTALGGGITRTATLTLEVEAPPEEDFTIVVSPTSSVIEQGETATHIVTINALAGFKSTVDLSAPNVPTGATATFSLAKVTPGVSSTLTIRTNRSTPTGAYAVTIAATGGGKTHDATIALTIKEGKPPSLLEILSDYSWIIIALLVVLVAVMALLALRKRRPSPPPTTSAPPSAAKTTKSFCASCGAEIPDDAQFCPKCGAKKVST